MPLSLFLDIFCKYMWIFVSETKDYFPLQAEQQPPMDELKHVIPIVLFNWYLTLITCQWRLLRNSIDCKREGKGFKTHHTGKINMHWKLYSTKNSFTSRDKIKKIDWKKCFWFWENIMTHLIWEFYWKNNNNNLKGFQGSHEFPLSWLSRHWAVH